MENLPSSGPDDFTHEVRRALGAGPLAHVDDVVRLLADTADVARAHTLLEATACSDAIRCEVARCAQDEQRRRLAVAHIRDYAALVHLATASGDPATRAAAEARLRVLSREEHAHTDGAPARTQTAPAANLDRARLYVPRFLQQRLAEDATARAWTAEGTAVLMDITGFTALSERLARRGREGAEQISEAIGRSFEAILMVAYDNGGSLLKFGGDAMLLWFEGEGHAPRASRAAVLMRRALRAAGRIETPGAKVSLRMAQGVHSDRFDFFAAGDLHLEFIPAGPAWRELVVLQRNAASGEILVSERTAALLPAGCRGARTQSGVMLAREPAGARKLPLAARPALPAETLAHCLSPPVREHVVAGGGTPEHRPVTIAFLRFAGTDALIEQQGAQAATQALHRLITTVTTIAAAHEVTFLGSDVDIDGGKLILTAGAPRVIGDDEERMLLALRAIVEADLPLSVRIGVHRGAVFAGDIGPFYRRTYTVMGDAVNLAARLMSEAEPGTIYATEQVLEASHTLFATEELEPLRVKGKAAPVRALSVGKARGSRARQASQQRLPLIGRDAEMALARVALDSASGSAGRIVEVVGDAGVGKSRLLEAVREEAGTFRTLHAVCEAYTASTPYALWRELLRELLGFGRDDVDAAVEHGLRQLIDERAPDLVPWLPLLAIPVGLDIASTPQIDLLTEKNRRAKAHETVCRLLDVMIAQPTLVVIENAHHMDPASAELLSYLAGEIATRPWVFALARRTATSAPPGPDSVAVRIPVGPLSANATLTMAQAQSEHDPLPLHVLDTIVQRSGGNPQFLQDLVRAAMASGGLGGLPESAEAAAAARIDALAPRDRSWVRRAAVFGLTFHPRMMAWIADDDAGGAPASDWWGGLADLFDQEPDGYVQFRQSLLRDAAYEGLPYSVRRRLHGAVAARLAEQVEAAEESAGILSLHCYEAGDYQEAWRYAALAARRAQAVYAYVEAAGLYARALAAGRRLANVPAAELSTLYEAQAESWYRAGEFGQAGTAYASALRIGPDGAVARARLLLKRSWVEEKLGKYPRALSWAARARKAVEGASDLQSQREAARATSWYASVLQLEGRTKDALRWAQRAVADAKAADDPEALGEAYYVMGWAYGALGEKGAQEWLQRSLEAYQRSGNLVRQAGLLSNLGVVCQWEGRWDEAMAYYERGRDDSLRLGNTMAAAVSRINIAEVLIDRGEVDEAEAQLKQTLPLWKASRYRFFLGACYAQMGRASLRAGRFEQALQRLAEARASFEHVGAEAEVQEADALVAECRVASGDVEAGLEQATALLARTGNNGGAKLASQLHRVRAHALRQRGDVAGARVALEASLAAARKRGSLLDVTLALLARLELDDLEGVQAPEDIVDETRSLLARLKIRDDRGSLATVA